MHVRWKGEICLTFTAKKLPSSCNIKVWHASARMLQTHASIKQHCFESIGTKDMSSKVFSLTCVLYTLIQSECQSRKPLDGHYYGIFSLLQF